MSVAASKKQEYKKYHGITDFEVWGVNPSREERNKFFGFEDEKEPGYWNLENQRLRIDFLLYNRHLNVKTRVVFWLKEPRIAKSGKMQYVDRFGNFRWAEQGETITPSFGSFDNATKRAAYDGEESLTEFIRVLANVRPIFKNGAIVGQNECRLEHINTLLTKQDYTELKEILNASRTILSNGNYEGNRVICALGLTDDKYYNIYNKSFVPGHFWQLEVDGKTEDFQKKCKRLISSMDKDATGNYLKENYGVSPYSLREFVATPQTEEVAADKLPF